MLGKINHFRNGVTMNRGLNSAEMLRQLERFLRGFDWSALTKSKQTILDSFLRVATREGIANVSMRSLAAAAGVKPPTIYSHFPDGRDQVLASAMKWHYSNFAHALKDVFSSCVSPEEYWEGLIRFHVTQQLSRPENDIWDALIATDRIADLLPQLLRAEIESWENFCDYMYSAIAQDLGYNDVDLSSRVLRKTLDAVGSWWKWDGSQEHLDQAVAYCGRISRSIIGM
ncbi:TetR/AcrR family transcriptional regulator [Pseudomonas sp. BGM005]|nr:TetR/AcrR family transcriptional regulator [Pseudomonas sp. BG5]